MNKYYIKFGLSKNFNAGSKAMKDVMTLLESSGYRSVRALPTHCNKLLKLIDIPLLLLTLFFRVGRGGTLLYFMPSNFQRIKLLKFFRRFFPFKLVCFINDVESFRMEKGAAYAQAEMKSIGCADIVLVPNEQSAEILRKEYGFTNHLIPVGVWDYLTTHRPAKCNTDLTTLFRSRSVAFAGNLRKSPFIEELNKVSLPFMIWGSGHEKEIKENTCFMGEKTPEELIEEVAACAWGLVWDGDSIERCSGLMGTYLRFNNSHKCGLYLCAGLPVIVWKESGMSSFVEQQQVGISVSSLSEAAEYILRMDIETYCTYRKNAEQVAFSLSQGNYFLNALNEVEKQ